MRPVRLSLAVLSAALVLAAPGCGHRLQRMLQPNHPPVVRLDAPRVVETTSSGRVYSLHWTAEDSDGRIQSFAYSLDPRSPDHVDAAWQRTTTPDCVIRLDRASAAPGAFHRFAVRAIDDRGSQSEPGIVAIAADNIPPVVAITCPHPGALITLNVSPAFRIAWDGADPDGIFTTKPIEYRYLLLGPGSEFPISVATAYPDSLRDYYANHPSGPWTGWVHTAPESAFVRFTNLVPGAQYLFAVIAFDEFGAYSPVFSLNTNMLRFVVTPPGMLGPRFALAMPGLYYTYPTSGYSDDPSRHRPVEVAGDAPLTVTWFATSDPGACFLRYRWALDPSSLGDSSPRSDPSDVHHWSNWSELTLSAAVGPLGSPTPPKRALHTLYVEAEDTFGTSLAAVDLVVVTPVFAKDLLFVDDTRRRPDQFLLDGTLLAPQGIWPGAAELDTFLFARGGMPWAKYPAGSLSPPGLFAGYEYDTLGTRREIQPFVPLSTLIQYRYVVWYVDYSSAEFANPPGSVFDPITALRAVSSPGQRNVLSTYVTMGGHVWLAGSGVALANLIAYDVASNNGAGGYLFSSTSPLGRELGLGRFMYDGPQWQSSIRVQSSVPNSVTLRSYTGRHEGSGGYPTLPATLSARTPASDPLPPFRTPPLFYPPSFSLAYLNQPNEILSGGVSALDTLMIASGLATPPSYAVTMTCTPPGDPHVICTGFDFWQFQRPQCLQLVDFVLHDLWGLTRTPSVIAATTTRRPVRR